MINKNETNYRKLLRRCLKSAETAPTSQGVDIRLLTGEKLELDMRSVPILTGKQIFWRSARDELELYLNGKTNHLKYFHQKKIYYWDQFADDQGNLGPIYGHQWINWNDEGINQIETIQSAIKAGSTRRRLIISGWNVGQLYKMALPPCVMTYQINIISGKYIDMQVYQRSADAFIGVPFDILQAYILAKFLNKSNPKLQLRKLTFFYGNFHIYVNHIDQVKQYLKAKIYRPPVDTTGKDELFNLEGYKHGPYIKGVIN